MIKKSNIYFFALIMMAFCLFSCEEEYIHDHEDFESRLVVNSLFSNDAPWSVHVSKSFIVSPNVPEDNSISFATVEIFDQDNKFLYRLDHIGDGIYQNGDVKPSPKRGYSIKVSAPGFSTVTATSFAPEKSKLIINNFSITPNEESEDLEVDFVIQDRSKLESYYIWEIVSLDGDTEGQSATDPLSKTWIDDLTNNSNNLVDNSREILGGSLFGDGTYNGSYTSKDGNRPVIVKDIIDPFNNNVQELEEMKIINIDTDLPEDFVREDDVDGNPVIDEEGDKSTVKYELRVMSISKELFTYYTSVEKILQQNNNSEDWLQKPYTNVANGLGIFAGYSESVIQF